MAHHALRLDMRDFKAALATLLAQCAAGKALSVRPPAAAAVPTHVSGPVGAARCRCAHPAAVCPPRPQAWQVKILQESWKSFSEKVCAARQACAGETRSRYATRF